MPKVVDHEQRREEIADALWQVIRREGLAGASVRTVAAESGWSTGAIRYYFSSQSQLLVFAMATLIERAQRRAQSTGRAVTGLSDLPTLVEEVLPLDAQRKAESEVWLALVTASRTDPSLGALAQEAHRQLRGLCDSVVRFIAAQTGSDLDVVLETDRLHGLIDGLAFHSTMYPRLMPRTRIRAVVRAHLDEIAERPRRPG